MDKKSKWIKIIDDQKTSGLTVIEYCKQRELNFHTFHYWKKKIVYSQNPPLLRQESFLPVKIKNVPTGFTVKFESGQVTFLKDPDPKWFAQVLQEVANEIT